MQMHKQYTQFDPSQYISKKHYKYQKGGAQKRPQSNDTCKGVACKIAAPPNEVPERGKFSLTSEGLKGNIKCRYKILYIKQFNVTLNIYAS